jgi:hypothetical protein
MVRNSLSLTKGFSSKLNMDEYGCLVFRFTPFLANDNFLCHSDI